MVVVGICFKTTLNKAFLTCKLFTADMAAQLRCCPVAGIGIHSLTPSPSPLPLPRLLGLTDLQLQEQMAKGHSYGFNMGHGKIIPFKDYKEAAGL